MDQLSTKAQRGGSPLTKSFIYKKIGLTELEMIVHYPPGWKESDKRAGIVFFFGGGWTNGHITQFQEQAAYLAGRGMVAACADYRVKSRQDVTPRECVEDAKSAVRWLRQNAATLGVDPHRIAASGGSAGAHIAACTSLIADFDDPGADKSISCKPNALVLFNAALRVKGCPRLEELVGEDPMLSHALSPLLHIGQDCPPTLLLIGTKDDLLPQSQEFAQRALELSCHVELFTAEGAPHGFFNWPQWKDLTTKRMAEFLESIGYLSKSRS